MGEATRRRKTAFETGPWPGGDKRCPRCFGTRVICQPSPDGVEFYGRKLAICICGAAWEPIEETLIWDRSDPHCSLSSPCDNCAFRPGSPEQADKAGWLKLIESLKAGRSFHCHKGVPLAPASEHGFAYPADKRELRTCRGYLNALGKWWGLPHHDQSDSAAP